MQICKKKKKNVGANSFCGTCPGLLHFLQLLEFSMLSVGHKHRHFLQLQQMPRQYRGGCHCHTSSLLSRLKQVITCSVSDCTNLNQFHTAKDTPFKLPFFLHWQPVELLENGDDVVG